MLFFREKGAKHYQRKLIPQTLNCDWKNVKVMTYYIFQTHKWNSNATTAGIPFLCPVTSKLLYDPMAQKSRTLERFSPA